MPITESNYRLQNVWFLFSIDKKPQPAANSFLIVIKAFQIRSIEPFAIFIEYVQSIRQYIYVIISSEHMPVVLLILVRKFFTNIVKHLSGHLMASQEIVESTLATLATKSSLLLEVEVTCQIHSNLNKYVIQGFSNTRISYKKCYRKLQFYLFARINGVVFMNSVIKQLVFNIGVNLLNYKLMQGNTSVTWQLTNLFNLLFCRESLRKNTYIFNSLNERMEISIKTIAKQRRVAQITNDFQQIIIALKQCPCIEMQTGNFVKILMKGDDLIVKLTHSQGKKIGKKDVQTLIKHMRCDLKESLDHLLIEFQSNAAITEFIERMKTSGMEYKYEILEKNPYRCIEQSIGNMRKQKKNQSQGNNYEYQQPYNNMYYSCDMSQYYSQQFPIFIRRAIPSDDEAQEDNREKAANQKKYIQKPKSEVQQRPRFNSEDFPSFQKLNISEEAKLERM